MTGARGRKSSPKKGLAPGSLKAAIEAHAIRPSPLALNTELARVQVLFSTRGHEGLDDEARDVCVLHLWDVGACWDAWPDWAEARFPHLIREGYFEKREIHGESAIIVTTKGVEAMCAQSGRAIDAAPQKPCVCVICAAAQLGRTMPLPFERGAL